MHRANLISHRYLLCHVHPFAHIPDLLHLPLHSVKIGSLNPLAGREFDTVACLNVLDRCSHPLSLLRTMRGLMRPATGRLLLAVVFPFHPCVEVGWGRKLVKPVEDLGMDPEAGWEMSVNQMVEKVLRPAGFEVTTNTNPPSSLLSQKHFFWSIYSSHPLSSVPSPSSLLS